MMRSSLFCSGLVGLACGTQYDVSNAAVVGGSIGAVRFSASMEAEAGCIAAYLMDEAEYDLNEAQWVVDVMAFLDGDERSLTTAFLNSHLASAERLVAFGKTRHEIELGYQSPSVQDASINSENPKEEVMHFPIEMNPN